MHIRAGMTSAPGGAKPFEPRARLGGTAFAADRTTHEDTTMASTAPTIIPQPIDDLRALYAFREPEAVVRFLRAYPHVVPLLIEARPHIVRHFGDETPVVLEVVPDRETGNEDDDELFALIQTDLPPEEARPRFARFDDWWLANLKRAECRLEFDLWYR